MDFIEGKMLIGGKLVDSVIDHNSAADTHFYITNPYTRQIIGKAPSIADSQLRDLLQHAAEFKCHINGEERAKILEQIAVRVKDHETELAEIITAELGICLKQSTYEVGRTCNVFTEAAAVARWIDQEDLTTQYRCAEDKAALTVISEPRRLVVAITPFNHPSNQISHKLAPAIAAGTPIIIKPSEKTPLTALYLGQLAHDLIPPYLVNIITTKYPESVVEKLVTHPAVEGIFFTGGIDTGKRVKRMVAASDYPFKKEVYELGGSAPLIVLEDADLDLASKLALGAFDNSGQRCTAVRRIIVQNSIADAFINKFVEKTRQWRYGNPTDPNMDMGTVINEAGAKMMQERVEKALGDHDTHNTTLLYGNIRQGALYSPTILDRVNPYAELVTLETFGPVAPIIRANSFGEAIELANRTKYALAAAVVTASEEKAKEVARKLRVGQFNWNNRPGYRTEQAPFGGRGWSGEGKEGVIEATRAMRWIRTEYTHT